MSSQLQLQSQSQFLILLPHVCWNGANTQRLKSSLWMFWKDFSEKQTVSSGRKDPDRNSPLHYSSGHVPALKANLAYRAKFVFNGEANVYNRIKNKTVSTLEFGHQLYIKYFEGSYLRDLHVCWNQAFKPRLPSVFPVDPQHCSPKLPCKELKTRISQHQKALWLYCIRYHRLQQLLLLIWCQ